MKKILHIQVLPKLSGVQKISLEILSNLPNTEYEKWIIFSHTATSGDVDECIAQFEKAGVNVLLSKKLKREIGFQDIPAIIEIYKLCRKERFDIVHTHSTKPGIIGRIAATLARSPNVIHTVHGLSFHQFIKFPLWQFYWLCEMFSSLFCNKIVLVNKFYSKYFKWFQSRTETIYNGINFDLFKKEEFEHQGNIKILYVGRLDPVKDPITLLKAMSIVTEQHPLCTLTMVGDGEKYDECSDFIKSHNLQQNVTMEGWQTDVSKYYSSHDIFAMSSIYESFGLIFLEAGYYHLPVVATNVEGIPEVVQNGETGLLCDPKDYKALANNIITLIENESMRTKMGEKAYKRVTTHFSAEIMVNKYKEIYTNKRNLTNKILKVEE